MNDGKRRVGIKNWETTPGITIHVSPAQTDNFMRIKVFWECIEVEIDDFRQWNFEKNDRKELLTILQNINKNVSMLIQNVLEAMGDYEIVEE